MAVSKRLRFEILRRDNYTCHYCGASAPDVKLTIDHVLAVTLGGKDEPTNLVTACRDCNFGKTSISPDQPLVAQVSEDALRWGRAMSAAAAKVADDVRGAHEYVAKVVETWEAWDKRLASLPDDFEVMCNYWRTSGMPAEVVANAIDIAWSNRRVPARDLWRYTIGIMKNRLQDAEKYARELIESGDI